MASQSLAHKEALEDKFDLVESRTKAEIMQLKYQIRFLTLIADDMKEFKRFTTHPEWYWAIKVEKAFTYKTFLIQDLLDDYKQQHKFFTEYAIAKMAADYKLGNLIHLHSVQTSSLLCTPHMK